MSDDQLQRLMAVLDMDRNRTVCLVVKWLLFTGARVNEALKARWQDIDREHRTWLIQSAASKSKRRRSVPLSDAAMAVLDQLASAGKSEWLFCSSRGGRMTTINKAWQRLRVEADVPHLRLHDLRHMHASMLINSGHSLYVVQQVLGHSQPSVTARYSHLSTTTLQEAANSVGDYVNRALENTEK
jgi:integrase